MFVSMICALSFCQIAQAGECDFDTTKYRNELLDIQYIKSIDITANKYQKWAINQLNIITRQTSNIDKKHKKKFKARISVTYPFGTCLLHGKIRQNGDLGDHIQMSDGNISQSLNVELSDGNIAGIVGFKLFLPHTRNGNAEVFATTFFGKFNLLAPRTRYITSSINETRRITYLFQENPEKEFLEYNNRREGAIFEGLENAFWEANAEQKRASHGLITTRVSNSKWAIKGLISAIISTTALTKLNRAYTQSYYQTSELPHLHNDSLKTDDYLYLSGGKNAPFIKNLIFHNILSILGGDHGLYKNNRKFHWNSLEDSFEPIYYDGNVSLKGQITVRDFINATPATQYIREILTNIDRDAFLQQLQSLGVDISSVELNEVFNNFQRRLTEASSIVTSKTIPTTDYEAKIKPQKYDVLVEKLNNSYTTSSIQNIYTSKEGNLTAHTTICSGTACNSMIFNTKKFRNLLRGKLNIDGKYILPPTTGYDVGNNISITSNIKLNDIMLSAKHTAGTEIKTNAKQNSVSIKFETQNDWIVFANQTIPSITINVKSNYIAETSNIALNSQRFNNFGLTGCLNFYKVDFKGTNISTKNTACEDAVNFVNVSGEINNVTIDTTFADAIDADFSNLIIKSTNISNAGNDCLDFSYGKYEVIHADLKNCGDKAVSVGEHSTMNIKSAIISKAKYAFVSKDSSQITINAAQKEQVEIACAAYNKKPEFYGAIIIDNEAFCFNAKIEVDKHSKIIQGLPQ